MFWYILLASVVSSFVGSAITIWWCYRKTAYGTLKIDNTNPREPIYRFQINEETTDIIKKKQVILKVDSTYIYDDAQE